MHGAEHQNLKLSATIESMKFRNRFEQSGSALVLVMMFIAVALASSILFMSSSIWRTGVADISKDSSEIRYQVESVYNIEQAKLDRAVDGIILNGRLPVINASLADETAFSLVGEYQGNELQFLRDIVEAQSVSGGVQNPSHEFADFDTAFPSAWTDLTPNDQEFVEVRYTIEPRALVQETTPINRYIFEYSVRLETRGYSSTRFINFGSDSSSIVRVALQGAPFSQWSLFRSQTSNPSGTVLWFAGGNTSAQIQDVFRGPVHTNSTPYFYGHPTFYELFTSAVNQGSWAYQTASGYSGTPNFVAGAQGGASLNTPMPTEIFNTTRLAAGDPDQHAATNNSSVSSANLLDWVENFAGGAGSGATGSLPGGTSSVPKGIYVPVNDLTSKNPTGGIYVEGNARIVMDVVQGAGDFTATQWGQIQAGHQSCKFQKIRITSLETGVLPREVYVGDEPCDVTYVFQGTGSSATHALLNGRINGNIHVNGEINELGGASRTRPSVAQDFAFTISALKDVYIKNDLQYEDVEYVSMDASGSLGSTAVATPTGEVGGSGVTPTSADIAPTISEESKTVLGIVSVKRNVMIRDDAPSNLNIHAAIYAGNSAAHSGGLGCGSSHPGCGFGVVNYQTITGKGQVKVLGSISEYRSPGMGVLSNPPKGYARRYLYDARYRQDLTPPAFPISNQLQAYPEILPVKTWRISENSGD